MIRFSLIVDCFLRKQFHVFNVILGPKYAFRHRKSGVWRSSVTCPALSTGITSLYDVKKGGQAIPEFLRVKLVERGYRDVITVISGHFALVPLCFGLKGFLLETGWNRGCLRGVARVLLADAATFVECRSGNRLETDKSWPLKISLSLPEFAVLGAILMLRK